MTVKIWEVWARVGWGKSRFSRKDYVECFSVKVQAESLREAARKADVAFMEKYPDANHVDIYYADGRV